MFSFVSMSKYERQIYIEQEGWCTVSQSFHQCCSPGNVDELWIKMRVGHILLTILQWYCLHTKYKIQTQYEHLQWHDVLSLLDGGCAVCGNNQYERHHITDVLTQTRLVSPLLSICCVYVLLQSTSVHVATRLREIHTVRGGGGNLSWRGLLLYWYRDTVIQQCAGC